MWYAMRVNRDKEKLLVTCVCSNIEREAAVRTETIGWIIGILIAAALVWWIYRKIKRYRCFGMWQSIYRKVI